MAYHASCIFIDKVSGKNFDRPRYQAMIRQLRPGDRLCVTSIDRLGRNYGEILEQWRLITKEKKADIQVFDMPLLDTRNGKDLLGTLISDLVLQLLSFVAQHERESIRKRQAEGIASARARGVRFGRKPGPLPKNFAQVVCKWKNREISEREAAKTCGMARSTFRYRVRAYFEKAG